MKTKKLSINIVSLLSECILQNRNNSYQISSKKIQSLLEKISIMHKNTNYDKEFYFELIDKTQYNIQQKCNTKQNRIIKDLSVLIHFKLTQKANSNVSFIESWLVSTQKLEKQQATSKINTNEQLIYLLQEVIRALKCQFLNDFLSMSQQLRTKYIMDYEIQINPSKKSLKKLYSLSYENIWKKFSFIDEQNIMSVTCYHNVHRKIKSILNQNKVQSRYQITKLNVKHGSQQTKPSYSGQYELSTSVEEKVNFSRQRKTSVIQFYDEDLNITVLSNDSDSFKKSTGRVEGVYVNQNLHNQKSNENQDSDDDFQLLIQESMHEQAQKIAMQQKQNSRINQIQLQFKSLLYGLDKALQGFFN